jgi:hypothetical protein
MYLQRQATGNKTQIQRRTGVGLPALVPKANDKRALQHSAFLVTINTNVAIADDVAADVFATRLADALDSIAYNGGTCELWGNFFKVNTGRGRKWLDKKHTKPNPKHDPKYNSFYERDDKQGLDHWCSLIEKLHVESAAVEWAPGTKRGKNQYAHAHVMIKIDHRTRLLVDTEALAEYIRERAELPHKPYVHSDAIKNGTEKVIDYILKNTWNKRLDKQDVKEFFTEKH